MRDPALVIRARGNCVVTAPVIMSGHVVKGRVMTRAASGTSASITVSSGWWRGWQQARGAAATVRIVELGSNERGCRPCDSAAMPDRSCLMRLQRAFASRYRFYNLLKHFCVRLRRLIR
jgi:hypothetical protein